MQQTESRHILTTIVLRRVGYYTYCTSKRNLNVSQIRPFIENEESFRKFCHGSTTLNSFPRSTTVTDSRFFEKKYFYGKILYVFRRTSWVNITGAQSKSSKILENPESWDWKSPYSTINIVTWARRRMPFSRRTRAEHDKPIFIVQKFITGVGF